MNMYQMIRKIHLFATLILATFVFMYFATGFVMIFEETFQRKATNVETIKEKINGVGSMELDSLLTWAIERFDLSGQFDVEETDELRTVRFSHPGTTVRLKVLRDYDSVHVEISKGNFISVMHQYHRLHRYEGGLNYYAWAFVYDLSAISMIVFAITGVYLWYKTERKRLVGWLVLLASTLLTGSTIFYMIYN